MKLLFVFSQRIIAAQSGVFEVHDDALFAVNEEVDDPLHQHFVARSALSHLVCGDIHQEGALAIAGALPRQPHDRARETACHRLRVHLFPLGGGDQTRGEHGVELSFRPFSALCGEVDVLHHLVIGDAFVRAVGKDAEGEVVRAAVQRRDAVLHRKFGRLFVRIDERRRIFHHLHAARVRFPGRGELFGSRRLPCELTLVVHDHPDLPFALELGEQVGEQRGFGESGIAPEARGGSAREHRRYI